MTNVLISGPGFATQLLVSPLHPLSHLGFGLIHRLSMINIELSNMGATLSHSVFSRTVSCIWLCELYLLVICMDN